jgi:hypothetical protein
MRHHIISLLAAASITAIALPSEAQSSCGSAATVAKAIWDKVGASVKAKGCKNVDECMAKKDKWEATVREAIAFWNEQAGGGWATIGPRPLLTDGSLNDGKVILGGERLFISRAPLEDDSLSISIVKEGGGGADVTISTFDGSNCVPSSKVSFEKNDKKGTNKSLKVTGAKGKLVVVKVNADNIDAFDYKFKASK